MVDLLHTVWAALVQLLTFIVDGGTAFINQGGTTATYLYLAGGALTLAWGLRIALDRRDYLREAGWDHDDQSWVFPAGHFVLSVPFGLIGLLRLHGHPDAVRSVVWGVYALIAIYAVVVGIPQASRAVARNSRAVKAKLAAAKHRSRPGRVTNPFGPTT